MSAPTLATGPMAATRAAQAFQKAQQEKFREEVIEGGRPYVIADATTPHEIFHAMDIPVVTNEFYSAVVSAKRLSAHYFDLMDAWGFDPALPRYNTLPFFTTLAADGLAPYGGLPKPLMIVQQLRGDFNAKVGEQWSAAFGGVPLFCFDTSSPIELRPRWYADGQTDWERIYESHRIDFQLEQIHELIAQLETLTGACLDTDALRAILHRVNHTGELVDRAKQIIARARPTPVSVPEQFINIMAATWNRGSQWAVDHMTAYCDELEQRAADGVSVCPEEKLRLLWLNNGLWQNTAFYRAFEESHRAVFVWTLYSNFLSDGYRRYFGEGVDPLRSLAARHISMSDVLHLPGWMPEWIIEQARDYGADGAVMLVPLGDRLSGFGTKSCAMALEKAGIPVLSLEANAVDARLWDNDAMMGKVSDFLSTRVAR